MKSNKKSILSGSLLAGAILSVSALGSNATALNTYSALGSASEVRAELLSNNVADKAFELKCGKESTKTKDAKCGTKKEGKAKKGTKSKTKDMKCGEGKCGGAKK